MYGRTGCGLPRDGGVVVAFCLTCENCEGMFDESFPVCAVFVSVCLFV